MGAGDELFGARTVESVTLGAVTSKLNKLHNTSVSLEVILGNNEIGSDTSIILYSRLTSVCCRKILLKVPNQIRGQAKKNICRPTLRKLFQICY